MPVPPPAGPRVSAAELRPHQLWYVAAGVIAVLGLLVGVVTAGPKLTGAGETPTLWLRFGPGGSGGPALMQLTADRTWGVYVDSDADDPDAYATRCTAGAMAGAGEITLSRPAQSYEFTSRDARWHLIYEITVTREGNYGVECDPDGPNVTAEEYALGTSVDVKQAPLQRARALGVLAGTACPALLIGGVIALVVTLRRNSHRRRLLAQRTPAGPPPPGPQPPGPPPPAGPSPHQPG
ncbi:MAG: hypothetical protein ACRDTM_01050 [Micromonosporaceae bacterium]